MSEIALSGLPDAAKRFLARRFDGIGDDDPIRALAADIVGAAIADEVAHRGVARLSDTLGVFLEYRIAEAFAELQDYLL